MPSKTLPEGKLPIRVLKTMLRSLPQGNMLVSPQVGIDVGVTKARGKYLVSSSDPITGTKASMGWHAVNVSVNDVATCGIMPDELNIVALFPTGTTANAVQKVISEISETASGLGITVAGGHTEITPGLKRPIIIVTAIGSGNSFVTAKDAKQFDSILMTKTAGIEGSSILAKLPKVRKIVGSITSRKGAALLKQLSILKEARIAFKSGRVHAMHDVTEGGILGAVYEMSLASNLGFEIYRDSIPIDNSTRMICAKLSIDPIRLIGSGSLLMACSNNSSRLITSRLESQGIRATTIGRFLPLKMGRTLKENENEVRVTETSIRDELWNVLRKYGNLS
ncbi:MAG: AIR synthase family protein [Nitrososphaerales archaeon]